MCSSPCHSQADCPKADPTRQQELCTHPPNTPRWSLLTLKRRSLWEGSRDLFLPPLCLTSNAILLGLFLRSTPLSGIALYSQGPLFSSVRSCGRRYKSPSIPGARFLHGQNGPQVSFSPYPYTPGRLESLGYLLAGYVLCRYVPSLWVPQCPLHF